MNDFDEFEDREILENAPSPEEVQKKTSMLWKTLIVMLVSGCLGTSILLVLIWLLVTKVFPTGG